MIGKSRRVKVEELKEEEWLKTGWSEDTIEHGVIQAYAESDTAKSGTTWIANQVGLSNVSSICALNVSFGRLGVSRC